MKIQKIVFLLLLLAVSLFVSAVACFLLKYQLLDINNLGFQFTMFSVLGSFAYFSLKYLKMFDALIVTVALGLIFAYVLRRTSLLQTLGGFLQLALYLILLFLVFLFVFRYLWFARRSYLRSLTFSISSALGYTAAHLVVHVIIRHPIQSSFITNYFMNGLLIMITISLAFNLAEYLMQKLDDTFFVIAQPPEEEEE